MSTHVYKILRASEPSTGIYPGSPLDQRDGFVHLSSCSTLQRTVELYFENDEEVLVLGFVTEALGPKLLWEKSRDDLLFPHLHAVLSLDDAVIRKHVKRVDGKWPTIDLPV